MKILAHQTASIVCLLLMMLVGSAAPSAECHSQELPLAFNGKDLAGWIEPPENIWWRVAEENLIVKSGVRKRGSILWTKKEYQNFIMEFNFRFISGTVDSGIFLRHENDQIQIGISGSLKRDMTGSPYIVSEKSYPCEATGVNDLLKPDDWNTMTIMAKGAHYSAWLNSSHILDYSSKTSRVVGPIGIQLHPGREMEIHFRNIKLAELE